MGRNSYFQRTAGCVKGQALSPPRHLFALLPSIAESAGMADMPQDDAIQRPIVAGKRWSGKPALETTPQLEPIGKEETRQRDAILQPTVESKGQPVALALETPHQPAPIQTPSPDTLPAPSLRRKADPSASPPVSAQTSTRPLQPFQIHTKPLPAAVTAIHPRRLGVLEFKELETRKPIEPPLADAAAPERLSLPTPPDPPRGAGILGTSFSFPRSSTGAKPSIEIEDRTVASKRNFQEPEDQPATAPSWVESSAREQDRDAAGPRVRQTSADGGTVHIGSLEIKITQSPAPPLPSQAALPVHRAPAVPPKPLSREFPTFGIGQAY